MKDLKKEIKRKIARYGSKEYWKSADEYQFETVENGKPSGKLSLYAHSPRIAKLKATNWEKWLIKEGRGKNKVLKDTIKKMIYK